MGPGGVPGASALCRPSCGGRTGEGVGVPVGGPPRAVGPAAGRERCSGAEAGAGSVGSGARGVECSRRVRDRCVRAGRRPVASLGVPHGWVDGCAGGVRSVQVGQQRAYVQGVGVPDEDLTEDRGVGGKQYAMPGGVAARSGRMSAARDVG